TVVAPSALCEVIWVMPGTCANCRSKGAATDVAMVSALAPCQLAVTWMVGKSTWGSGATGRNGNDAMPTNATAAISSLVATARPKLFVGVGERGFQAIAGRRLIDDVVDGLQRADAQNVAVVAIVSHGLDGAAFHCLAHGVEGLRRQCEHDGRWLRLHQRRNGT